MTMRGFLIGALATLVGGANWGAYNDVPQGFDCSMRALAYDYGRSLLPRQGSFRSLYDALDLADESCDEFSAIDVEEAPREQSEDAEDTIFVAVDGDDAGTGSIADPLRSLQAALDRAVKKVVLRGGTYYLTETVLVTSAHSGITVEGRAGETAIISGGEKIKTKWTLEDPSLNIWSAPVDAEEMPGLQIDGARLTRARYPNLPGGIEVSPGYGAVISQKAAKWHAPDFSKFGKPTFYTDTEHERQKTPQGSFGKYTVGTGGLCSVYDPPVSYWCASSPAGGGAFPFRTPSGLTVPLKVLPNAPYKDPSTLAIFVFHPGRWANWMFEDSAVRSHHSVMNVTFGRGGNQGARGSNVGGDFFVENVREELDAPGEYFFDAKAKKLFVAFNGTKPTSVVVPRLRVLVSASASQFDPLRNFTLRRLQFRSTRTTYMDPHGVPSGGDWALERQAAVFAQGTIGFTVKNCVFERLDGNGLIISGFNRHAILRDSDFAYIGGSAIVAWGYTNETKTDPGRPGVNENAPEAGVDGTDGEHPRYTLITGNSVREVGLYEKQASFFVQAKTAETTITGNVFFNGPRAGINMNDGFGGGDEVSHNLVFSTCRETSDHGPFNSWDRQPFLTTVRTGKPSMQMAWREIHHNFFVDNYSPQENIDNDDGSAYYKSHHNFLVYGGNGLKNDWDGHDNWHYENIYAYAAKALQVCATTEGHEDRFFRNKAVLSGESVGQPQCAFPETQMFDNKYYTPTGDIDVCGLPLREWQEQSRETNSTVDKHPTTKKLISWARNLLFLSDSISSKTTPVVY